MFHYSPSCISPPLDEQTITGICIFNLDVIDVNGQDGDSIETRRRAGSVDIRPGAGDVDISGNEFRTTPRMIPRNGPAVRAWLTSLSLLDRYTGGHYCDPSNTVTPIDNEAVGIVTSHGPPDFNSSFRISEGIRIRFDISNQEQYYTKRPAMCPGPGVWPSDGRSFTASVRIRI